MEAKLQALIDRDDIWQMMLRYSRGIDRMDLELLRSCYHPDAIDDHGAFVGSRDAFIEWARDYHMQLCTVHHHGLSNHWCELDGDTAHCETYYHFIAANREGPHTLAVGRYLDRIERREGEWRIAGRVCVTELVCDLAESALPAAYREALFSNGPAARDRGDVSYARPLMPRQPTALTAV